MSRPEVMAVSLASYAAGLGGLWWLYRYKRTHKVVLFEQARFRGLLFLVAVCLVVPVWSGWGSWKNNHALSWVMCVVLAVGVGLPIGAMYLLKKRVKTLGGEAL